MDRHQDTRTGRSDNPRPDEWAKQVATDPIGNMSVASIGVSDVDRWVARIRKAGVGEGAIRNRHTVLRSALQQAVRWEWIATNPASNAPIRSPKRQQQRTLTIDEVWAVIAAAAEVHDVSCVVGVDLCDAELQCFKVVPLDFLDRHAIKSHNICAYPTHSGAVSATGRAGHVVQLSICGRPVVR